MLCCHSLAAAAASLLLTRACVLLPQGKQLSVRVQQLEGAQNAVLANTIMRGVPVHLAAPDLVRVQVRRQQLIGFGALLSAQVQVAGQQQPIEAIESWTALVQREGLYARPSARVECRSNEFLLQLASVLEWLLWDRVLFG